MKYPMFSMRDEKVGFGQPMVHMSEEVARRDFAYKINQPDSMMGFAPKDFSLYRVGEFDTDSAKIVPCLPEFVCSGTDVFGV